MVNPEPYNVAKWVAALCTLVTDEQMRENPHLYRQSGSVQMEGAFIRVFVNPPAEVPRLEQLHPQLPEGAILVKEKLPTDGADLPDELRTGFK